MSVSIAHPIQTLRQHSTNFEAALSVCLAEPKERAVHKLRTESRRLEAQIALLKLMKGLPPFRTEARKAEWQIKKVRQAAGRVRDLDVQAHHLKTHARKVRLGSKPDAEKQQELADLDAMLAKRDLRRTKSATKLLQEIQARQLKVSAALEKLYSALKHDEEHRVPSAELLTLAQKQFDGTRALTKKRQSADDLHTVRKAAKQARYLAENAGAKTAAVAAKRFEDLQELGGAWHDWLELSGAARKELGKKHGVTGEFVRLRDHHLERFRGELEKFVAPNTPAKPMRAAKR